MPDIKGVEIMSVGRWNGNDITMADLKDVVDAFNETQEFSLPHLKLGHNDDQKLLENDGLPAAGWVTNVYIHGKKLLADFSDVPRKIYELIRKKAYRKVSVEIFKGYTFKDKTYNSLLSAVALLGADRPAMANLNDILSMYSLPDHNGVPTVTVFTGGHNTDKIKTITMTVEADQVGDKSQENDDKLAKEVAELKSKLAIFSKEKEEFQAYRNQTDAKIKNLEDEKTNIQVKNFCLDLSKKDLLTPGMEPIVSALISAIPAQKFSVGEKKDISSAELIGDLLAMAKQVYAINQEENTEDIKPKEGDSSYLKTDKAIKELMANDRTLSYSQAYRHITRKA